MTRTGIGVAAVMLSLSVGASRVNAQTDIGYWSARPPVGENGEPIPSRVEPVLPGEATGTSPKVRSREFVVAPLPIVNPTLDNGVALVVGALYPLRRSDTVSPPSATFLMGMATSNDSWAAGAAQTLHFDADRYRVLAAAAYFDVNFDYFGIGSAAGAAGRSIRLNQAGTGGIADALVRVAGQWYAGARYRMMQTTLSADLNAPVPLPAADLDLRTGLLGPHLELDTRDEQYYPTSGWLVDGLALFAGSAVGGQRSYQIYQVAASRYAAMGSRHVVAAKVNSCFADGDVPFYDLCLIGQYQDLRGYPMGQYRDRNMVTAQGEYRVRAWWRFGLVAFGGLGEVAPALDQFTSDDLLPSGGAGVRFKLTRETPLNLRVDYAWGRRSNALYVSVGEAF